MCWGGEDWVPEKFYVAEAEVIRMRKGDAPKIITLLSTDGGMCWQPNWKVGERWAVSGRKIVIPSEPSKDDPGYCDAPELFGKTVYLTMPGSWKVKSKVCCNFDSVSFWSAHFNNLLWC